MDISANTRFGALRAIETLLQLVQNGAENTSVPWVTIEDSPRFPWRGLLLDSARHFIPLGISNARSTVWPRQNSTCCTGI